MPYARVAELPPQVRKGLPPHAQQVFRKTFNNVVARKGTSEAQAFKIAWAAAKRVAGNKDKSEAARTFTTKERKRLAGNAAMPDGSYPIKTTADLRNAIQAFGRAKNKAAVKAHIRRRARALGATNLLPDSWKKDSSMLHTCPDCDRAGLTEKALAEHAAAVHTHNETRQILQGAVKEKLSSGFGRDPYPYVVDVSDDWFVYDVDGKLYRSSYSMSDGAPTIGDPTEVMRKQTYVPVPKKKGD